MRVPSQRIRVRNAAKPNPDGLWVLYWMTAYRRLQDNFALDRAVEWSRQMGRPLVVLEALRSDYPFASDRLHTFIVQGMVQNQRLALDRWLAYVPYVEPNLGGGKGLLQALAAGSCAVVTDEFPCFMLPRMVAAAAAKVDVCLESVDSTGLLPMAAADRVFDYAHSFRRFLQRELPSHLGDMPSGELPTDLPPMPPAAAGALSNLLERWPSAPLDSLLKAGMAALPIDHAVEPVWDTEGGWQEAQQRLHTFLDRRLSRYAEERNFPEEDVTSGLSPYLHFGHISAHRVFAELAEAEGWTPHRLAEQVTGSREGWWGMSESAEAFLDQIVTWRELGFNLCWHRADYDLYDSLPDWAKLTLGQHAHDPRKWLYSLEELESAKTHDELWNSAQRQLRTRGIIHNYMRMVWGKKILEWSPSPQEALARMILLNDKYALDGRDPNSYSGIFWVLGRYDRAWGPERKIFGKIRYMTTENTARKLPVESYLNWFR